MSRNQIEAAIASGRPFWLRMADGHEYHVKHSDYISLSPKGAFVTVYDDERFYVLPLITMTGIVSAATTPDPSSV